MVTVAVAVSPCSVCAVWLHSAVFFIRLKHESLVVYSSEDLHAIKPLAHHNMVNAVPLAFIFVGSFGSVAA